MKGKLTPLLRTAAAPQRLVARQTGDTGEDGSRAKYYGGQRNTHRSSIHTVQNDRIGPGETRAPADSDIHILVFQLAVEG